MLVLLIYLYWLFLFCNDLMINTKEGFCGCAVDFLCFFSVAVVCDWFWSTNKNYCCGCVADFAFCISCFFVLWLFVVGSDQHKSRLIHSCAVNQLEAMTAACSTSNASKSSSAAGTAPHKYFRKTEKNIACEQPKLGVKSIFKNTVVLVEASISQTLLVQIV